MTQSNSGLLRFSFAAILSTTLFAIAILSPLMVRNENLKQTCYDQQLELIELEARNKTRELFAQRMENSPSLMNQDSQPELNMQLPSDLIISPEQLLVATSTPQNRKQKSPVTKSRYLAWAEFVTKSPGIANRLMIFALCLLILGCIPGSWFHWQYVMSHAKKVNSKLFSRYCQHSAHSDIPAPHWEENPTSSPLRKQSRQ